MQATGTTINVIKPVPKTFKVFFPTNLFVFAKDFGAIHKQASQIIITNVRKHPKSKM